jgi:hypothetical protein
VAYSPAVVTQATAAIQAELTAANILPAYSQTLQPHLAELWAEGAKTHMAHHCPAAAMSGVVKLERALVELGLLEPSKRSEDPSKYAAVIRRKQQKETERRWAQERSATEKPSASEPAKDAASRSLGHAVAKP